MAIFRISAGCGRAIRLETRPCTAPRGTPPHGQKRSYGCGGGDSTFALLKQLQALPFLSGVRLVGGTALALQLGHRKSVDLDLFGFWNPEEALQKHLAGFRNVKNGRLRVVAAVALDTHSGQRKLAGIMRYFNETLVPAGRPWDFEVQPNSFFVTPGWARRARRGGVDGIILSDYPSDETMRLVARSGIPCVVETAELKAACRMSTPSSSNVVRIICDARELAREAAQKLVVRQSFVSFGYVGTAENEPWSRERGAFFKEALAERGRECAVFNKSKRAGLGSWLASLPRPAAIFAANDSTAREVANAALGKGLREIERKSAHAVIRERRLEYASRLLAETKRSIEKITADCGFTNRTHLKKLFKTAFGCSMREWRRRSQKSG